MTGLPSCLAFRLGEDRCRPHGIPFDRSLCPPDDDVQDEICRVNGELDGLAVSIRHGGGGPVDSALPRAGSTTAGR